MLIRGGRVAGVVADVRLDGPRITAVAPGLRRRAREEVIDARGGEVIPGLHDHHVHLRALWARQRSVTVGPPAVRDAGELLSALRRERSRIATRSGGWIRAVGYHESVAGELDRHYLDRCVDDRPLRVQHRSGILWILNSKALAVLGLDELGGDAPEGVERDAAGKPTGRLWRLDDWLARTIAVREGSQTHESSKTQPWTRWLAELGAEAARKGVVGWTDATPGRSDAEVSDLRDAATKGWLRQRLHLMLPLEAGTSWGDQMFPAERLSVGAVKVMLDDARLPELQSLSDLVSAAHLRGRTVAFHCVTRAQLVLALTAISAAVPSRERSRLAADRIEHGAVIPAEILAEIARHELTVVTQPNFVYERGDEYLEEVDPYDLPHLWRGRSLLDAGIAVAAGTDAPFGVPDPWLAIRASMRRLTRSGRALGIEERVGAHTALGWWTGTGPEPARHRTVTPGAVADLAVLHAPLEDALAGDDPIRVRATIIGGEIVFRGERPPGG